MILCFLAMLETLPLKVSCARLADIYWNASNPIFRIDNTDHIIDVNKGNIPFEYDQVNIICPVYTPGTKDEDVERYIIYNVSKEEYDSCRITNPGSRIIAVCDKPHKVMYFTITFRSFTPQPGGLEFRPGQDYYFISTSGGSADAIHQKIGGRCATHNMKVIFKVCCSPEKTTSTTQSSSTYGYPSTTTSTVLPPFSVTRFRRPSTTPYRIPPVISSKLPNMKTYDYPRDGELGKTPSKKTEDRDKLPNETRAKNEELVNNSAVTLNHQRQSLLVISAVLVLHYLFSR